MVGRLQGPPPRHHISSPLCCLQNIRPRAWYLHCWGGVSLAPPSHPLTLHHLKLRWTGSRQASPPEKGETISEALSARAKTLWLAVYPQEYSKPNWSPHTSSIGFLVTIVHHLVQPPHHLVSQYHRTLYHTGKGWYINQCPWSQHSLKYTDFMGILHLR